MPPSDPFQDHIREKPGVDKAFENGCNLGGTLWCATVREKHRKSRTSIPEGTRWYRVDICAVLLIIISLSLFESGSKSSACHISTYREPRCWSLGVSKRVNLYCGGDANVLSQMHIQADTSHTGHLLTRIQIWKNRNLEIQSRSC